MSPQRLLFFLSLGGLCLIWALVALSVSSTRFEYRNMIESIRAGEEPPSAESLHDAVAAYASALTLSSCNAGLHADMALLLGQNTDYHMAEAGADEDTALKLTQEELATRLSCTPMDGKAWLDFATVDIYREGFTKRALGAYRMSAQVAPGESWLAEKRLLFALQFHSLFDVPSIATARNDLAVLKRAHPNRMNDVIKLAELPDESALYAVFGAMPKRQ